MEPAFYDHMDDTRPTRTAADWGADEVFASVPRRRFRGDQHGIATGQRRGPAHHGPASVAAGEDEETAARAAWLAEVEAELAYADLPTDVGIAGAEPVEALPQELTEGIAFEEPSTWSEEPAVAGGRRTVTIAGRPDFAVTPRRPLVSERRRPPRTVEERIGARPDRVASWSFGMGLLLIVVAALS